MVGVRPQTVAKTPLRRGGAFREGADAAGERFGGGEARFERSDDALAAPRIARDPASRSPASSVHP